MEEETLTTETSVEETDNVAADETSEEEVVDAAEEVKQEIKWYETLNDEYKNHPSIQKFQDANGLAKSYLSLESMMGQEKVPVPKNADDKQAWSLYNKAFNVPEEAEKYDIKIDGVEQEQLKGFKDIMHKHHISNEAAQDLLNAHIADFQASKEAEIQKWNKEAEDVTAQLKQEWGLKYDANLRQARTFLEKMCDSKDDYDYYDSKIGNDPKFIKLLSKMGNSIAEGSLGGFEGQSSGFTKTPAEAKQELEAIMNDTNDAFWAGARNKRNDAKYCKEHGLSYVSEEERKARVAYVNSLMKMQG